MKNQGPPSQARAAACRGPPWGHGPQGPPNQRPACCWKPPTRATHWARPWGFLTPPAGASPARRRGLLPPSPSPPPPGRLQVLESLLADTR